MVLHIPLGIVCGILFKEAGFAWYVAPLYSLFVFAAAMQFVTLSMLMSGSSLLLIALTLIPIGVRNIIYGLTMIKRFEKAPPFLRGYMAFGLIDGIYSILQIGEQPEGKEDVRFITYLCLLAHITWVLGTLLGSFVDLFLPIPPKLEFSLTAFFAAAAFEMVRKQKQRRTLLIAFTSLTLALLIIPKYFFLGGILLSAAAALIIPPKKKVLQ